MSVRRYLTAGLLVIVLLTGTVQTFAASGRNIPWTVEKVGTFDVPQELQVVELSEVLGMMNKDLATMKAGRAALTNPAVNLSQLVALKKQLNMNLYHLTINNGKAYYTASLFLYRDQKPMDDSERQFFGAKATPEQREQIEKLLSDTKDMASEAVNEVKMNNSGIAMLELAPVEYFMLDGKQAYGEGVRIVGSVYGVSLPMYAKSYVFDAQGNLAVAVLLSSDAERSFWEPVMRRIVRSYH